MKIWKRVILGVVFSFVAFFTCLGYAALTDNLFISGTVTATMPKDIFITAIEHVSGTNLPSSIVSPTNMKTNITGTAGNTAVYKITVLNNTKDTYVYTGIEIDTTTYGDVANKVTIESSTDARNINKIPANSGTGYVSGTPIEPGGTFTFYTTYTLTDTISAKDLLVNYSFKPVIYTITYVHNSVVLDTRYVYNNRVAVSTENSTAAQDAEDAMGDNAEFGYWMDAGNTERPSIDANYPNKVNDPTEIVLYPKFNNPFTAMFVNQDGGLLAWSFFNNTSTSKYYYANADTVKKAEADAREALPDYGDDYVFDYWIVKGDGINDTYDINKFASYTKDVTIYPMYKYKGDVELIPVDSDNNGSTDYYQVGGYGAATGAQAMVEIPESVNGRYVTEISADAFSSYDDLHSISVPGTVTTINSQAFTADNPDKWGTQRDTVTIYCMWYINPEDGTTTKDRWNAAMDKYNSDDYSGMLKQNWDNCMGDGSRVFFLNANGKVDKSAGYWELNSDWIWYYHKHEYSHTNKCNDSNCMQPTGDITNYLGHCDCAAPTTGDTAHTYVDANGNVMGRNEAGTPVNASGTVIEYKRKNIFSSYKLTTNNDDTYYRYRPDTHYWPAE